MSIVSKKKPTGIGPGLVGCHDDDDHEDCTADIVMISKDQQQQQQQQQQLNRFLSKTFHMVNNKDVDVVSWSPKGDSSFVIKDIEEFSKTTLPLYFNHSKYSSFVRQLNFYGFTKVKAECSPLRADEDEKRQTVFFYHQYFRKDRPDLLHNIHRVTKKLRCDAPMFRDNGRKVRELQRQVDALQDGMRVIQKQMDAKIADVKHSVQREYEKRIDKLEQTCMGMIVLLQQQSSATSTCSSPSPIPSSLHSRHYSSLLGGGYPSSCLSSSPLTSSVAPAMVGVLPRSFWTGDISAATLMASSMASATPRRGSWGAASSSTTTTGGNQGAGIPHTF